MTPLDTLYQYYVNYKAAMLRGNEEAAHRRLIHLRDHMRLHGLHMGDLEEEAARRAQMED